MTRSRKERSEPTGAKRKPRTPGEERQWVKPRQRGTSKAGRAKRDEVAALEATGALPPPATASEDTKAQMVTPAHGRGKLLRGGVPGNRGHTIATMRKVARRRMLVSLLEPGGGIALLREHVRGVVVREVPDETAATPGATKRLTTILDEEQRRAAVRDMLQFALGGISAQALLGENDETLESGVVVLPALAALPAPAASDESAVERPAARGVRDAAAVLLRAAAVKP